VHRDDVRMRELREQLGLAEQPLARRLGLVGADRDELHRDRAIELGIEGLVHDAHPAAPDHVDHDVASELRPTRERVLAARQLREHEAALGAAVEVRVDRVVGVTREVAQPRVLRRALHGRHLPRVLP
jgi:hypothetical protein